MGKAEKPKSNSRRSSYLLEILKSLLNKYAESLKKGKIEQKIVKFVKLEIVQQIAATDSLRLISSN